MINLLVPVGLALLISFWPQHLAAQSAPKPEDLKAIEKKLENERATEKNLRKRIEDLRQELMALRQAVIKQTSSVRNQEKKLAKQNTELVKTAEFLALKRKKLTSLSTSLANSLAALERVARQSSLFPWVRDGAPVERTRGLMLLRYVIPRMEEQTRILRSELEAMQVLRNDYVDQQSLNKKTTVELAQNRQVLEQLTEQKSRYLRDTETALTNSEQRIASLASQARDMRDLLQKIAQEKAQAQQQQAAKAATQTGQDNKADPAPIKRAQVAEKDVRPFPKRKKQLSRPAQGLINTKFGQKTEYGAASKGLSFSSGKNATIIAPYDGQVVFAGPFRGYGRILILEHRGKYHSLLSGMETMSVRVGDWILAGEPVGNTGATGENLYFELRYKEKPVNPLPWLKAENAS